MQPSATHLGRAVTFFVTLSGCAYDQQPAQPDAAPLPDAAAPMPDASAVARVTVMLGEAPAAGVPVVFHGIAEVTTDSAGHASHQIIPDTTVTTAWFDGQTHQLQTVLGIQPGDDVVLGNPAPHPAPPGQPGTIQVSVPPFPGTWNYWIDVGCNTATATQIDERTVIFDYTPDCLLDGKLYVVARASDISYGTLALASESFTPPVTSAALTWVPAQPVEVDVLNMPADATANMVQVDGAAGSLFYNSLWLGSGLYSKSGGRIFLPEPPTGMIPDYYLSAYLWFPQGLSSMEGRVAAFAPVVIDFRPFIPCPVSATMGGSTIRWSANGPMDSVQGMSVQLIHEIPGGTWDREWTITLPPSTSLVLPELPPDLAAYRLPADSQGSVTFFSSTRYHSYADVRRRPSAANFIFMWYWPGPYRFFWTNGSIAIQ